MRLLHIINSSNPAGGGPIESIVQARRVLAPQGHDFELVCVDPPDSPWLPRFDFPVHALGPPRTPYRYSRRLAPWLHQQAARFDAAIVHGIWLYPSCAAHRILPRVGVPYFIYAHGLLDPSFKKLFPLKHLKKNVLWKMLEHKVLRDARAVLFTCEEERRLASQSFRPYACREEIVPYCVGEPPSDAEQQKRVFFERFPECRDRRLILFLSRLHPKKGCDLALRAFAQLAPRYPSLRLIVAGPDSVGWRRDLEMMAARMNVADRITWTGMLTGDLKWGAFRVAEAFILPSHQENFGIAVVEALACGVPVLISNKVNIWREIEAAGAGFVESDSDVGTFLLLDRWLALPPLERENFRQRARRCFTQHFRAEEAAATLLAALRRNGVST